MTLLAFVLILCSTAGLLSAMRIANPPGAVGALVCLIGLIIGASILMRGRSRHIQESPGYSTDVAFLARLVAGAFVLRLLVAMALHTEDRWWVYLGGDEATFHASGVCFSLFVDDRFPIPVAPRFAGTKEFGFFYLVGAIYYTFGVSKVIPLIVTAAIGACTVYPIHALTGRFVGRDGARFAARLVAFFPSLILWSSLMVRDCVVLFFIVTALLAADHLRRKITVGSVFGVAASLAAVATLRTYIFIILAVAIAAAFVIGNRGVVKSLFAGAALMAALIMAIRVTGVGQSHLELANLEKISQLRQWNALGPSIAGSLGSDVDISTPTAALSYLPIGMVYFLFSPLPWQIGSPRQIMAVLDLVIWYSMLPSIIRGFIWLLRRNPRSVLAILFSVLGITVLYSLVEGNIGIIFRHRAQIIVPLCVVAGVGWAVKRRRVLKESTALEGPLPFDPAPGGALRPTPGL